MAGIGSTEIIIIAVVLIILFGGPKLIEFAREKE
jgi:Sec-independent protein translocase protein TatA